MATSKTILNSLPDSQLDSLQAAIDRFLLWEMRSRDSIEVKRCYIDVAADLEAGVLLSQIIYWHLPDKKGEQKLTVQRDGRWWLAKGREDWWDECRLTPKQFDRAIRHLEARRLVCTKVYKWRSTNIKHIRVDWAGLLQALSMLEANPDKVVGFRRREPVRREARTPSRKALQDEQLGLSNRQFSELPNSQSLNSLIGNSQIPKQASSELPIREFLYIDPKITQQTTSKDNSSPLPPAGEMPASGTQLELCFSQPMECNTYPLASHTERSHSLGLQVNNFCGEKLSAPSESVENLLTANPAQTPFSPVEVVAVSQNQSGDRFSRDRSHYPKNIDGSDRLPWETGRRGVFDSDFEQHMARSLGNYPAYKDLLPGELLVKVRKHICAAKYDLKRRDELEIEWKAMHSLPQLPDGVSKAEVGAAKTYAHFAHLFGVSS